MSQTSDISYQVRLRLIHIRNAQICFFQVFYVEGKKSAKKLSGPILLLFLAFM